MLFMSKKCVLELLVVYGNPNINKIQPILLQVHKSLHQAAPVCTEVPTLLSML